MLHRRRPRLAISLIALAALGAAAFAATGRSSAQTPPPSPTPAVTAPAGGTAVLTPVATLDLTRADDGKTFHIAAGTSVTVHLGADFDWTVSYDPADLLVPVPATRKQLPGVQAVALALRPGTVTISAEGRPHCSPGQACSQVFVSFLATVVVDPSPNVAVILAPGVVRVVPVHDDTTGAVVVAVIAVLIAGVASAVAAVSQRDGEAPRP